MLSHLVDLTGMRLDRIMKLTAPWNSDTKSTKLIAARHIHSKIKKFIIDTYPNLFSNYTKNTDEYGFGASYIGGDGIKYLRDIWYIDTTRPYFYLITQINSAYEYTEQDRYAEYIHSKLVCVVRHNDYKAFITIADIDENFRKGQIFCVLPIKEKDASGNTSFLPFLFDDTSIEKYFQAGNSSVVTLNKYIRMAVLEWPTIIDALRSCSKMLKFSDVTFEIEEEDEGRIKYVINAYAQTVVRYFGSKKISLSIKPFSPITLSESLLITIFRNEISETLVGTLEMLRRGMIQDMLANRIESYIDQ
jgi:hypothetical protein